MGFQKWFLLPEVELFPLIYRSVHVLIGCLWNTVINLVPLKILVDQGVLITNITLLPFMVGVPTLSLSSKYCHLTSAILRSHTPY